MKISVSLPDADVEYLDELAARHRQSRSGALQLAVRRMRASELGDEYQQAWDEWESSGDGAAWDVTTGDGLRS